MTADILEYLQEQYDVVDGAGAEDRPSANKDGEPGARVVPIKWVK